MSASPVSKVNGTVLPSGTFHRSSSARCFSRHSGRVIPPPPVFARLQLDEPTIRLLPWLDRTLQGYRNMIKREEAVGYRNRCRKGANRVEAVRHVDLETRPESEENAYYRKKCSQEPVDSFAPTRLLSLQGRLHIGVCASCNMERSLRGLPGLLVIAFLGWGHACRTHALSGGKWRCTSSQANIVFMDSIA